MSPGPLGPSGTLAPLCLDDELQAESSESQLLQLRGDRMQTVAKHTIKIPEILLHVLEYLTANELVCAALVCKAWTIAIEVRWRHRPVPLSLLLENLSPLEPLLDDERTLAFQDMPSPAAWERVVKQFSNKVTHLSFDIELDEPSTAILRNTHSPRLCPNLKTLDIQVNTESSWQQLLPLFFTDQLECVRLASTQERCKHLAPVLKEMALTSLEIKELTLEICIRGNHIATLSSVYSSFENIRVLRTSRIDALGWTMLEDCRFLKRITLPGPFIQGSVTPERYRRVTFPVLCELVILSTEYRELNFIIKNTIMPSLRTLHLRKIRTSALAYEKLQPLLELLIRRSPLLVDISLSNPDKPEGTFQRSVLQSVKTLGGLQMLELSLGTESQHVTDENMNELLQCLPRLRYLAICDPQWVFPIRGLQLSPRTLLSLAQHCPALEKVEGLPVDFTISQLEVTPDGGGETWATSTITFPSLTDLSFGSLSVYDGTIPKLANYLAVACSRLKAVTGREIRVDLQGNGFESRHSSELMNAFLLCRAAVRA
ncbi:hypothetical protein FRB96_003799 [Tulasnella sp. 330]|nr:hypothetical protein FRB96_003799 [Tulasnella sp. 330]